MRDNLIWVGYHSLAEVSSDFITSVIEALYLIYFVIKEHIWS